MTTPDRPRLWICGEVIAELGGKRIVIPSGQLRTLVAALAFDRHDAHPREQLIDVLWPFDPPANADGNLSALISRLRKLIGDAAIVGRSEIRLDLPFDAWIDVEAAREALDRATGQLASGDPVSALPASHVAAVIAGRPFLAGTHGPWVDAKRVWLDDVFAQAHECSAECSLRIGDAELATAERSARALMERSPYRESGYRYAMRSLVIRGNHAEALAVYERCRTVLREELGADPGPELQALYLEVLQAAG
jgi:SARP family transcriptional regulator, regulator of embCAB operon